MFGGTGLIEVTAYDPLLPGDYNSNGIVDAADFTVWRSSLGLAGLAPFSGGDGTGDGAVTQADYDVWRNNFGMTLSDVDNRLVPEPGTMLLSCWGSLMLLAMIRRRRSQ